MTASPPKKADGSHVRKQREQVKSTSRPVSRNQSLAKPGLKRS